MMDKAKFYPLALSCSVTVRGLLYPLTVVKTRLQIQKKHTVYRGTFDAFRKIFRSEGVAGLYKGYWVNTIQVFSSIAYVSTYEKVRHLVKEQFGVRDHSIRGFVAGGCASAVGQTIIVPFDVISQHMMILGNVNKRRDTARITDPLNLLQKLEEKEGRAAVQRGRHFQTAGLSWLVIREIGRRDGLTGFYRGYLASLLCYVPNSASFWWFYHFYLGHLCSWAPDWIPRLLIQCLAAPLSGLTTTTLTNPLDLLRARLQVQRAPLPATLRRLWAEERLELFRKGLSARLISSTLFSFFIILGYESLKRFSVKEDYKHAVRW